MEALRRVAVQSGRSRPKISPFAEGGPRVQAQLSTTVVSRQDQSKTWPCMGTRHATSIRQRALHGGTNCKPRVCNNKPPFGRVAHAERRPEKIHNSDAWRCHDASGRTRCKPRVRKNKHRLGDLPAWLPTRAGLSRQSTAMTGCVTMPWARIAPSQRKTLAVARCGTPPAPSSGRAAGP